jgi:hypothetical protein
MHEYLAWSLEFGPWKVEGGKIDCIFHCIIMFSFCYSMILTLLVVIGTLCCNGQGPSNQGSNPFQSA